MNIELIRDYCLSLPKTTECFPFDEVTLVFKVDGKMFALIPLDQVEHSISLKCDPDYAIELREQYQEIQPGYHFNKRMWNTVYPGSTIGETTIKQLVLHSYTEVVKKMSKAKQSEIEILLNEMQNQVD